jgi:hypothetical protein
MKLIKRQTNMIAHTPVKAAYSQFSRYLFELIPLCIKKILINKMSWVCYSKKNKNTMYAIKELQ